MTDCAAGECSELQPLHSPTTVRVRDGMMYITDGPHADTGDHVNGFCLIEARDLNDAIRQVSKLAPARHGCVEVRPVVNDGVRE